MLLAYFGPETVLPLTSVLAAVAGFALMFGRRVLQVGTYLLARVVRMAREKSAPAAFHRNLRREMPARSAYHRASHQTDEVRA